MYRTGTHRRPIGVLIAVSLAAACGGTASTPTASTPTAPTSTASTSVAPTAPVGPSTSETPTTSIAPSSSASSAPGAEPMDFSGRGPFAVGVVAVQLDDGRPVVVLHPVDPRAVGADAVGFSYTAAEMWGTATDVWPLGWSMSVPDAWVDAPASTSGPFPLIVFSHGWGNTRFTNSLHAAHLASWGFVVAVPEHATRDITARLAGQDTLPPSDVATIVDTIALFGADASVLGSSLAGVVEPDRVAVEGYSAGGRDAALAAALGEVDGWISVAGTPPVPDDAVAVGELFTPAPGFDLDEHLAGRPPPDTPVLLVVAGADSVVAPSYSRSVFAWLSAPKRLVVIRDTGHVVFMDGCGLYQRGLIPGLVATFGLDPSSESVLIADDGCRPEDPPADDVAALWNHLVTAQLRWLFDLEADVAAASLRREHLDATFPGLIEEVASVGDVAPSGSG